MNAGQGHAYSLRVTIAPDGRTFVVGGALSIGRAPDNSIVIDDGAVSRRHATLTPDGEGGAILIDLESANGTTVNGVRITPRSPVRVAPGDNIAIAGVVLTLEATASLGAGGVSTTANPPGVAVPPAQTPVRRASPRTPRRERTPSPGGSRSVALLMGLGVILLFVAFVASNTADAKLLETGYYKGVLQHANAYERTYTEVAADPALADEVNSLVGGIGIIPGAAATAVLRVVPQSFLQGLVEASIDRLIAYLENHTSFDVSLDVTPVMTGLGLGAAGFAIGELIGRPTHEADSYEEFVFELHAALAGIKLSGSLPLVIPDYDIPENKRQEVTNLIISSAGLTAEKDRARIAEVAAAVADNDMETALKAGMEGLMSGSTLLAQQDLVRGKFIHETEVGGETRYLLGPPPEVTRQLSDVLRIVHLVSWASGWGRHAAVAGMIALLALLGWTHRANGLSALRWMGWPLLVAGSIGFAGWLIGRELAKNAILDASLGPDSTVPESFARLYRDVIGQALSDLTPIVWTPCVVAMLLGIALVGGAALANRKGATKLATEG